MLREIKSTQRRVRQLALRVSGTGTPAIAEGTNDGAIVDNGTGDWTITFATPFHRTPVIVLQSLTAASVLKLHAVSATSFQVKGFAMDGTTAKDADFHAIINGFDAADQN